MIKSIVAGNWKMNKTPKNGKQFISEVLANIDEIINVDIILTLILLCFIFFIAAIFSLLSRGLSINKIEPCFSDSSSRLNLFPAGTEIWVTSFYLMASKGGLETWANICLKYENTF